MLVCDAFGSITLLIFIVTVKITSILWHSVIICCTVFGFESRVSTTVRCLDLVYNCSYGSLVQVKWYMRWTVDCRYPRPLDSDAEEGWFAGDELFGVSVSSTH